METIYNYILSLPKKGLNSNKISAVFHDYDIGCECYLFKINIKENTCMMLNSKSRRYGFGASMSCPLVDSIDLNYTNCMILENHPYIGKGYKEVKRILENE